MIYLWLTTSITLNVMLLAAIIFKNKKNRSDDDTLLKELLKNSKKLNEEFERMNEKHRNNLLKKLNEIDQELIRK